MFKSLTFPVKNKNLKNVLTMLIKKVLYSVYLANKLICVSEDIEFIIVLFYSEYVYTKKNIVYFSLTIPKCVVFISFQLFLLID